MRVVVDENIPLGAEAFAAAGPVTLMPGREISRQDLSDCQILIVRSITKVGPALLEGTPVRFVGTCTIGTDHLDIPWLQSQGIRWTSAPGCNARSVAEWVVSALAHGHLRRKLDLETISQAGIIGVGRVGRAVQALLEDFGIEVFRNDPPRAALEGPQGFQSLDTVLGLPLVLAHLPLETSSQWPTKGLLAENLARLPPGGVFVNAGRGATVSTSALTAIATQRSDLFLALDVFDPEPFIPSPLASRADLISPHVAGYSHEGKIEGTRMVRESLGQFLQLPPWSPPPVEHSPIDAAALLDPDGRPVDHGTSLWDALASLIMGAHNPALDDASLRSSLSLPQAERGAAFDRQRKEYPTRIEWRHRPVLNTKKLPPEAWERAVRLGFLPG